MKIILVAVVFMFTLVAAYSWLLYFKTDAQHRDDVAAVGCALSVAVVVAVAFIRYLH